MSPSDLPFPSETGHYYRTDTYPPTPVWVNLDRLFVRFDDMPQHQNGAGLVYSGEVPGILHQRIPATTGEWLGIVDYTVEYADGRPPLVMRGQLVPFGRDEALGSGNPVLRPRVE